MTKFRWGMGLAVAMLMAGVAVAEDGLKSELADIRAKLAAQESAIAAPASYGEPEGLISLRKNAVVKIGGLLNVRYFNRSANVKVANGMGGLSKVAKINTSDLRITDSRLHVDVALNDNMGAFFEYAFTESERGGSARVAGSRYGDDSFEGGDNDRQAYIYFKDICNTGFGMIFGRNTIPFGMNAHGTVLANFTSSGRGDSWNEMGGYDPGQVSLFSNEAIAAGMFMPGIGGQQYTNVYMNNNLSIPFAGLTDHKRANQINPYWENKSKSFRVDFSLFQVDESLYNDNEDSYYDPFTKTYVGYNNLYAADDIKTADYGLQSAALKLSWKPIEGLELSGSLMNWHSDNPMDTKLFTAGNGSPNRMGNLRNNQNPRDPTLYDVDGEATAYRQSIASEDFTSSALGFNYRPAFFKKLRIWGEWVHGWDYDFTEGNSSDAFILGAQYNFTEAFNMFAMVDYLKGTRDNVNPMFLDGTNNSFNLAYDKFTGWATTVGAQYTITQGLMAEIGWRHENMKWKAMGYNMAKVTADDIYAHLGITF